MASRSEPVVWAELTTEEARGVLDVASVAVVPVGAVEQHGPHLAVLTDSRIAERFAWRLAADVGPEAVVCPLLPYGLSEHHERFPGTLTLRPTTFIDMVVDLVASLKSQGFARVIVVNGHGGNMDALSLAARRCRSELNVLVASMMWLKLARDVCAAAVPGRVHGHACELETSLALALAPELVRTDRLRPGAVREDVDPLSAPHGYVDVAVRFDELTADGVYGDPTRAGVELGDKLLAAALDRAVEFTRRFAREGTVV